MIRTSVKFTDDHIHVNILLDVCDLQYFKDYRFIAKCEYDDIECTISKLKSDAKSVIIKNISDFDCEYENFQLEVDDDEVYWYTPKLSELTRNKLKPNYACFFENKNQVSKFDEQQGINKTQNTIQKLISELEDQLDLLL